MTRNIVFVCHANPEDNKLALWLSMQLALAGYTIWCDLTKLLGGEDFWSDIESVIREQTIKFLFVSSSHSNQKPGTLNELTLANSVGRNEGIQDFIIPLHADSLRHSDVNIEILRLNSISFVNGWAAGLRQLLAKLERDQVPRSPDQGPEVVNSWWSAHADPNEGVQLKDEIHLSNWYPLISRPETISAIRVVGPNKSSEAIHDFPYPVTWSGQYAITFASKDELAGYLPSPYKPTETISRPIDLFLYEGMSIAQIDRRQARNMVVSLFNQAWSLELDRRHLPTYEFAGGKSFYFVDGTADRNKIYFTSVTGRRTFRQVVGTRTMRRSQGEHSFNRFWHLGLELQLFRHPFWGYAAKTHVLFSSDGKTIWENQQRLHRARRNECKSWWNAEWRDKLTAAMTWLSQGTGEITLQASPSSSISVSASPTQFVSSVQLNDPVKASNPVDETIAEDEDYDAE